MNFIFDNKFAELGEKFFKRMPSEPLQNPHLVAISTDMAERLNIDLKWLNSAQGLAFLNGEYLPEGADPLCMVYAGHQFGGYSPQLGDGRGNLIGQIRDKNNVLWDLHLKGAGLTPFSRMGDGKAVLRSTIREFLISETLHYLGIPTSRALGIIGSDETVQREKIETAALLMRVSETHIRFGHFEYFSHMKQHDELKKLSDHCLELYFPDQKTAPQPYDAMLLEITAKTAKMIAQWQAFGFAHGVMNTDNMSVLGQSFDYGPFGFMEEFNPHYICNHSDTQGRYAFDQQPNVGFWNVQALTQALSPLLEDNIAPKLLSLYQSEFFKKYDAMMAAKLGLKEGGTSKKLTAELHALLYEHKIDYTVFYRALSHYKGKELRAGTPHKAFTQWLVSYDAALNTEDQNTSARHAKMMQVNPKYILRNYLLQTAIEKAEEGDFIEIEKLLKIMSNPYAEQPEHEKYAEETPNWGKELEISCSS